MAQGQHAYRRVRHARPVGALRAPRAAVSGNPSSTDFTDLHGLAGEHTRPRGVLACPVRRLASRHKYSDEREFLGHALSPTLSQLPLLNLTHTTSQGVNEDAEVGRAGGFDWSVRWSSPLHTSERLLLDSAEEMHCLLRAEHHVVSAFQHSSRSDRPDLVSVCITSRSFWRPCFPSPALSPSDLVRFGRALLIAYGFSSELRGWISSVPLAWLVSVHLVRFVGFYFLWLYHGQLPFAFAVLGGWGDIVVATLALVLLVLRPNSRAIYQVWNALGFADILFVVSTATRLALSDPASMATLLRFPWSLLPTFIVPLIIFTHVVIFLRLKGDGLNRAA
jgi:hypothetical protein